MKRLTVSVEDKLYFRVRLKAAEMNTSVSELVKQFVTNLAGKDAEFDRSPRLQKTSEHSKQDEVVRGKERTDRWTSNPSNPMQA